VSKNNRVTVLGGGIGGLFCALTLAGREYDVSVLECDDVPLPPDVETAWRTWDRRGAPQARQPHVILGRFCRVLREYHPHVYQRLMDAGATETPFHEYIRPDAIDYRPEPGDEDLVAVNTRRLTVEWVLRQAVIGNDRITFHSGVTATGLVATEDAIPHVTGVRLADGSVHEGDLTVVASGKRTKLPTWFKAIGAAPMPEETGESGVTYISRFYRLPHGAEIDRSKPAVAMSGFLQGGVFEGDNRTFSVSAVVSSADTELRRLLLKPGRLERLVRAVPQYSAVTELLSEPISDVSAMAGVTNRWRGLTDGGEPLATGVVPVGDTLVLTNPTYGRGMSTAAWAMSLLSDALDKHPGDPAALIVDYADGVEREIKPWYHDSCQRDAFSRHTVDAVLAGETPPENPIDFVKLIDVARYDAIVQRAFARVANMLSSPTAMLQDPDVLNRINVLMQRTSHSSDGAPGREDIVAMLSADTYSDKEALAR
jgi:2-polyprenyl-6-methoxyphenol hydroxylase-like FAD-dependent oxidoreductase